MNIMARVQVTIEIDICESQWDKDTTVEQLHREGSKAAIERIQKLCQRYVRLVGTPKVEAIMSSNTGGR